MIRKFAALIGMTAVFAACSGGGGGSTTPSVTPTVTPTTTPTTTPTSTPTASGYTPGPNAATAFTCPSSQAATAVARGASTSGQARHAVRRGGSYAAINNGLSRLAITYSASTASALGSTIASHEVAAGATFVQQLNFSHLNTTVRIVTVPTAKVTATEAALRVQNGVQSVALTGGRRSPSSASAVWTNDPYFVGFQQSQIVSTAPTPPPATYKVGPYEENDSVPGQWDMHAIALEKAFGYSSSTMNTLGLSNANALGSTSVKIAVIDTGEDATHPELSSKIAYQKCFITNTAGVQSSGSFAVDEDGHGTDVSGIAAEASNNLLGFTGAGGNSSLWAYRVFPTPDDNCTNPDSTDPQCEADTADIAAAINDAVAQHVDIISMSLGGSTCGSGSGFAANGDSDPTEGLAVANAIGSGVIVVAAAGNAGGSGLAAPACDTDVIAVGATALDDGFPNASGVSLGGTPAAPVEYVASYSQYGTPDSPDSASAWGIVAPGGDPANSETTGTVYDLHWIENIWTSTPYQSSSSDSSFLGECTSDYPSTGGTTDCRTLIAGTSMATPHVAGAAALILAVAPGTYHSAIAMKQLLCTTADPLVTAASTVSTHQGCGRLNVYRAMAKALNDGSP